MIITSNSLSGVGKTCSILFAVPCRGTIKWLSLLYTLLLISGLAFCQPPDTWIQRADFGGGNRYGAVGFNIGNKAYLGTGYLDSLAKDFWEYDPSIDSWSQKADFGGTARWYAVGFSIEDKGYIGLGQSDWGFQKDFWEYDPAFNSWMKRTDFGGIARAEAVGFSIGTKGYIGTGIDSTQYPQADFWMYDPSLDAWTKKADFVGTRAGAVGFSIGDKGYLGTGYNYFGLKKNFGEYDPVLNTWNQKADFAGGLRSNAVGFAIGSNGYIGTGYAINDSGLVYYNDFWGYDPNSNSWVQNAGFGGTARSRAVGFSIDGKGYITTGVVGDIYLNDSRQDCWEYTPSPFGVGIPLIINNHAIFSLFPNPAHNQFVVDLQLNNEVNAEAKIEVINLMGQVIYYKTSVMLNGKLQEKVKLNSAFTGIYLVRVIVCDEAFNQQIVYEKKGS